MRHTEKQQLPKSKSRKKQNNTDSRTTSLYSMPGFRQKSCPEPGPDPRPEPGPDPRPEPGPTSPEKDPDTVFERKFGQFLKNIFGAHVITPL
jgi:hypothetical protein